MPAKEFRYYDDWKTEILTCPKCGWSGTFFQGDIDNDIDEFSVCSCPICPWPQVPELAIVWNPTLAETEGNFDKLSAEEKASLARRKEFLAEVERTSLKSPDELPDLPGAEIVLMWDFRNDDAKRSWTVIRHGDQVLWSERAVYEGAERFAEVVEILKQKYGARLVDLAPTGASKTYLYGDHGFSIGIVDRARSALRRPQTS